MAKYNVTIAQKEKGITSIVGATPDGTLIGSRSEVLTKTQTIIGELASFATTLNSGPVLVNATAPNADTTVKVRALTFNLI